MNGVIAVAFGQRNQAATIKANAVVMHEIRVLIAALPARAKPDLPVFFIDPIDPAHDEFAFGDLVFDRPVLEVDQVKVPPSVAFGGVDDFISFFEPVDVTQAKPFGVCRPDKGNAFFIDDIADAAGVRIDLDETITLVTSIDLNISEMASVPHPMQVRGFPPMFEAIDLGLELFVSSDIKDARFVKIEFITGQIVRA